MHILTWLYFLKMNRPSYRHITISTDRIAALPADGNISSSVIYITDDTLGLDRTVEIMGCRPPPTGLPAPSIRRAPIDEACI
jgi:hypothetical protein